MKSYCRLNLILKCQLHLPLINANLFTPCCQKGKKNKQERHASFLLGNAGVRKSSYATNSDSQT